MRLRTGLALLVWLCGLAVAAGVQAADVRLAWDAPLQPAGILTAGYTVYVGSNPRTYQRVLDVGLTTAYTVTNLTAGQMYYFAVTSYDQAGDESGYSNEVSATPPAAAVALRVTPETTTAGSTVTVTWSGIPAPTATDWLGLYRAGAPPPASLAWLYVSCSWSAGAARAAGSCPFPVPAGLLEGAYEVRLLATNGYTTLATQALTLTPATGGLTFTALPATVVAGQAVTVTWSGIPAPTSTDWIGLSAAGAPPAAVLAWMYVSCSPSAGAGRAAGTCAFPVPATLAAGQYELRLFANNGYTVLATRPLMITRP